jgi:hypothetical protein
MQVKYRNLFWPTILLIATTSTTLAFVSMRTKTAPVSKPERKDPAKPVASIKSSEGSVKAATVSDPASLSLQRSSEKQTVQAELVTILPTGFEPAQITRPPGRFILLVQNRSGLEAVQLRLEHETGTRLHDVHVRREKLDWNNVIDLGPGRYVLTEADHPGWACYIIVTAPLADKP